MYKRYLAVATLIFISSAGAAENASAGDKPLAQMRSAQEQATAGNPKACLKIASGVINAPNFGKFDADFRLRSFTLAAWCADVSGDRPSALRFAMQGTAFEGAAPELWRVRVFHQMLDDTQAGPAVETLEILGSRYPETLNDLPQSWIYRFYGKVKKASTIGVRQRLLDVLASESYVPTEVSGSTDYFRSELATLRVRDGDNAAATALVSKITVPSILLELSVDPTLRVLLPAEFDIRAAFERELTHRRDIAASHPGSLDAVIEVANVLRRLGRHEEALAGLEAASPDLPGAITFTDAAEKRNWWWDAVGYANAYLGKYDAAIAAFRHGIDSKEAGSINVSQTINLANQQLNFGRNGDAIATLAPLGEGKGASSYGIMQLIGVRGCAKFRSGDRVGADQDYAYAKTHEADSPDTLTSLALCREDLDEAAASLVRRLDDADKRVSALLLVSEYDPPPTTYPKLIELERLQTVKLRSDVKAAISRAGGARRFPIEAPPF